MHYLAIGHVCKDITPDGWTFGGTVTFAGRTARAIGCETHVITSSGLDVDMRIALPDVDVINSPADHTTTFENRYTPAGRQQMLHNTANRLDPHLVNALGPIRNSLGVVHLAPVAQEVDRAWLDQFAGDFVGITPQGWLRQWDAAGHVSPAEWREAEGVLRRVTATVISIEDVHGDEDLARQWSKWARVFVVTRGALGCSVYYDGVVTDLPTYKETEVDPTGAGDVFAAAFFVRLKQTASPIAAARFANCLATRSISRLGLAGVPTAAEIQHCLSTSPLLEAKYPLASASQ
jgi:sugar/nucleoside kinase (ribokinase family)